MKSIHKISFWCKLRLHRWDMPGGHCEECGKCDEFFGKHHHIYESWGPNTKLEEHP